MEVDSGTITYGVANSLQYIALPSGMLILHLPACSQAACMACCVLQNANQKAPRRTLDAFLRGSGWLDDSEGSPPQGDRLDTLREGLGWWGWVGTPPRKGKYIWVGAFG